MKRKFCVLLDCKPCLHREETRDCIDFCEVAQKQNPEKFDGYGIEGFYFINADDEPD